MNMIPCVLMIYSSAALFCVWCNKFARNDAGAGKVQWALVATQLCAAGGELGRSSCRATESRIAE
jgi:hypothetical protein